MARHSPTVASPDEAAADRDQVLAHKLLIELLSYQFAFPVRWIETQNGFFNPPGKAKKFVEVGPAKILTTMAKKTAAQQTSPQAASLASQHQFLSYADSKDEIYYTYPEDTPQPAEPASGDAAAPPAAASAPPAAAAAPVAVAPPAPVAAPSGPAAAVPDVPLAAVHIVLAITAHKLRKAFDNVPLQKTIRELSAGKSTLQNEVIGDLNAEFGKLPEGAEDLALEALGEAVAGNFSGKPGKTISALVSKFVQSKLPAGFNQAAVKDHLLSYWGLSADHAVIPICLVVTAEPPSRLGSPDDAKAFFNAFIPRYASHVGITLTPGGSGGGAASQSATMVDSASLEAARKEQRDFHMRQLDLLAKHLQIDGLLDDSKLEALAATTMELEHKLSQWNSEFDESFFDGIQPTFDAKKGRTYDSWWNWVREDLLSWFNDIALNRVQAVVSDSDERLHRILSRWEPSCSDLVDYLASGSAHHGVKGLVPIGQEILRLASRAMKNDPTFKYTLPSLRPSTTITSAGSIEYTEVPRSVSSYCRLVQQRRFTPSGEEIPFVHIKKRGQGQQWKYDHASTSLLLRTLEDGTSTGISFAGKTVLVTGAGPKSIGAEVVRGLLAGGARLVVTTSRAVANSANFYQQMYRQLGARGSGLTVVPFNQGSKADCEALVKYIFGPDSPTGGQLDFIVPFAALPDSGEIDGLGSKSELAHRAMLVNTLRLLGNIRKEKEKLRIDTRPTTTILPLSPNHGTFGGDGLYSESKLGLETLFNRFHSESWSSYVTICGAVIGWTRGTGLMSGNNIVAESLEERSNVITFSQSEMAFNILALMAPAVAAVCEDEPVFADLSGGLQYVDDLKQGIANARAKISEISRTRKALVAENARQQSILKGPPVQTKPASLKPKVRRANLTVGYPKLSAHKDMVAGLEDLQGMVDLSKTVVVVGFSELGPWGSSRTRWEMEHMSDFTLEGYIEMAWIMGLVKHSDGSVKVKGNPFVGWVDAKTQEPVQDDEFKQKYGEHIMKHSGLRFIEPESVGGYDPAKKEFLHEVAVAEDLPPFEASKATAEAFKLRHGDKVSIRPVAGSPDEYLVQVKKGAHFLVPKATPFDRRVAGQLPKGWDAHRYGIPESIVQQVDPITLYALCCVSEAFFSAGIRDPYELYKHIHVSELANCLGTGGGGMVAMRNLYKDRYLEKPLGSDILQESFLNTSGAWVNMLLLSSTGPIKTPVGACATAVESLDIGCEAIQSGKSKAAVVGGCDDFQEEMSFEFANMKATTSSTEEIAKGRLPSEMSRPSATTRSGFVESAGSGVQIIMSADLALEMGLPIYGIVAYSQMASDKIGRSVPAPGKGILTAGREGSQAHGSELLDIDRRRENLEKSITSIKKSHQAQVARLKSIPGWTEQTLHDIEVATAAKLREAQHIWSNDIRLQNPSIAPIRASLATWGLTINDIQVTSMHGTSTKANDTNEASVINEIMTYLGRRRGNPLLAVCQKSLTGHPKGPAGAWQFNGCMQMLRTGIVPGNRNADNVDTKLRQFEHIIYPRDAIQTPGIKATILTSFGFGQKGGIVVAVAPKYLFSVINESAYDEYRGRVFKRLRNGNTEYAKCLMSNSIFKAKDHSPWDESNMNKVLMDPEVRVSNDLSFKKSNMDKQQPRKSGLPSSFDSDLVAVDEVGLLSSTIQSMLESTEQKRASATTVGVDVESLNSIDMGNELFLERNFSSVERQYCFNSPDPRASFAGRWSAKEAVFKSLQVRSRGGGAAMNEIEILSDFGVPRVKLHGKAKEAAAAEGITTIQVSITHSPDTVTAIALAVRE